MANCSWIRNLFTSDVDDLVKNQLITPTSSVLGGLLYQQQHVRNCSSELRKPCRLFEKQLPTRMMTLLYCRFFSQISLLIRIWLQYTDDVIDK